MQLLHSKELQIYITKFYTLYSLYDLFYFDFSYDLHTVLQVQYTTEATVVYLPNDLLFS